MGKITLNYQKCSEGFKCNYKLEDGTICGRIEPKMNTMQKHCKTHTDPGIIARRKEYEKNRSQNPLRKLKHRMRSRRNKAEVRADPVKFEAMKKKERDRATEYRQDPGYLVLQCQRMAEIRRKEIEGNVENDIWLCCHSCDYRSRSSDHLRSHIADRHDFDQKTALRYKSMLGPRLKSLCAKTTIVAASSDSQELESRADFSGADLATKAWEILKEPLPHRKFYTYFFLCTNPEAGEMGLVPYLDTVKNNPEVTLNWYVGKNRTNGASSYHSDPTIDSTVRNFCEENGKIAFLIHVEKHDVGDSFENKVAAEANELYWQLIGEFQRSKVNEDKCQFRIMNAKSEISIGKERNFLDEDFVRETVHVAMTCDAVFCMEFTTSGCDKIHHPSQLCRDYGKKHLDLSNVLPYEFFRPPSERQVKIQLAKEARLLGKSSSPSTAEVIQLSSDSDSDSDCSNDFERSYSDNDFN